MTIATTLSSSPAASGHLSPGAQEVLTQSLQGFPGTQPTDIHAALRDIQKLPEFQPPTENWLDTLAKQPFFQTMRDAFDRLFERFLESLRQIFSHFHLPAIRQQPGTVETVFHGFVGFIMLLLALYTLYWVLSWFLQRQGAKLPLAAPPERLFEETRLVHSKHHAAQAQEAAAQGQYQEGIRQIYFATLCLLDETTIVPFEKTCSNGEYVAHLSRMPMTGSQASHAQSIEPRSPGLSVPGVSASTSSLSPLFATLATSFEGSHYGKRVVGAVAFQQCEATYQQFHQLVQPHD